MVDIEDSKLMADCISRHLSISLIADGNTFFH